MSFRAKREPNYMIGIPKIFAIIQRYFPFEIAGILHSASSIQDDNSDRVGSR